MDDFAELAEKLTPEQKHRYTQLRAAQRQIQKDMPPFAVMGPKKIEEWNAVRSMFLKPGESEQFDAIERAETDTEVENDLPLGKEYGSDYATAAAHRQRNPIRLSPGTQKVVESAPGYADGNSRYIGISERTFMPETKLQKMAKKYRDRRGK
jgi:hypothetical protein